MFHSNQDHVQRELFNGESRLPQAVRQRLESHWSTHFYEKVFRNIDETVFEPMYCSDNGRPNFPVNILVGLELLKEMHDLSDEQLYDRYYLDLGFQGALGIESIENTTFTLRTLYYFARR